MRTFLKDKKASGLHDPNIAAGDLSMDTYLMQVDDNVATHRLAVTRYYHLGDREPTKLLV